MEGVPAFPLRHHVSSLVRIMLGPCAAHFSRNSMKIAERGTPAIAAPNVLSDIETLKTIAIFCGLGLLVSLLSARHGLDLSGGFF